MSSKNKRQSALKERQGKLGRVIFPKPRLTLSEDVRSYRSPAVGSKITPTPLDTSPATVINTPKQVAPVQGTEAPTLHPGTAGVPPALQSPSNGRGAPCAPKGSTLVDCGAANQAIDLGERYTVLSKLGQGGSASV